MPLGVHKRLDGNHFVEASSADTLVLIAIGNIIVAAQEVEYIDQN